MNKTLFTSLVMAFFTAQLATRPAFAADESTKISDAAKTEKATKAEKVRQWELTAFKKSDTNGDGGVTKEELGKAPGNRLQGIRDHFDEMDANHDGKVTLEEQDAWTRAQLKAELEQMDANHDGTVTPEERAAWLKAQSYKFGK